MAFSEALPRLIEKHRDARLTDLLQTLANLPEGAVREIYERCKAVYEGVLVRECTWQKL